MLKTIKNENFLKTKSFATFHDAKFEMGTFSCEVFQDNHNGLNLFRIVFDHIGDKSFEVTKFL